MNVVTLHRDPRKVAYEAAKLAKRIRRQVGEAIADYGMIEAGDRVMVCLSGGKDSYGLLDMLVQLREKSPETLIRRYPLASGPCGKSSRHGWPSGNSSWFS